MSEEVCIEKLSHEGRGIARLAGKVIFVEDALPGERVRIGPIKKVQKIFEAKIEEIIESSPHRVTPPCPVFSQCGGCRLQHMDPLAQIAHKQNVLQEHLEHFGRVSAKEWLPPLMSETLGYRRKARLGVRYVHKKNQVLVGFRERNGRWLVDTDQCAILDPRVGAHLDELRVLIFNLHAKEDIAQIEIAVSDDTVALVFRNLKPVDEHDQQQLVEYATAHQHWVYLQPKGPDSMHRIWPLEGTHLLHYTLTDFDIKLHFSPLDFTQINHTLNPSMVSQAITLLDPQPHEKVLDAFCGIGNFSLPLAKHFECVVGIEGDAAMVQKARENALENHCHNTEFLTADLFQPLKGQAFAKQTFNKILLDPPRAGAEALVRDIDILQASQIVYISCYPATLARDAGILVHEKGYTLTHAGVMDMFPHTAHIESMAVFVK